MHLIFLLSFSLVFLVAELAHASERDLNGCEEPSSGAHSKSTRVLDEESSTSRKKMRTITKLVLNGEELGHLTEEATSTSAQKLILLGNVKPNLCKLGWFKNLVDLDISQANLGLKPRQANEGLEVISTLTTLQILNCGSRHVNDDGLDLLSKLSGLRTLIVSNPSLFGTGLPNLNKLTFLEVLDLSGTHVSASYLTQLQLPNLRCLKVSATFVSDAELESFKVQVESRRRESQLPSVTLDFKRV